MRATYADLYESMAKKFLYWGADLLDCNLKITKEKS